VSYFLKTNFKEMMVEKGVFEGELVPTETEVTAR